MAFLLIAALLMSAPAGAQQAKPSSTGGQQSATEDSGSGGPDLPVSLDRIREALARAPARPLLANVDRKPDFRAEIQIRQRIDELLSTLDFKTGPVPPAGIYAYEQQQRLWNSVNHPLMQPYAAFSGGELITLAIESLAAKYLVGRALDAITDLERARAQAAARATVSRAIVEYCGTLPADGVGIYLCDRSLSPR